MEKDNVNYILPWVPEKTEREVKEAFNKTVSARKQGEQDEAGVLKHEH